jgi:hypothetical protein
MGKLIGNQVPDKNGKTIPNDVMSGTYELRSLTNQPTEGLFEGKLVVDKTYGYAAHGCMVCCGYSGPYMYYDPFNLGVGGSGFHRAKSPAPEAGGHQGAKRMGRNEGATLFSSRNKTAGAWAKLAGRPRPSLLLDYPGRCCRFCRSGYLSRGASRPYCRAG